MLIFQFRYKIQKFGWLKNELLRSWKSVFKSVYIFPCCRETTWAKTLGFFTTKRRYLASLQLRGLQIIRECCHHYVFVCLRHTSGVDSSHIVVVDECAQNGFYRAAPPFDQPAVVGFVLGKFFVHFIIKGLVDTVFNLFKLGLPRRILFWKHTVFYIINIQRGEPCRNTLP